MDAKEVADRSLAALTGFRQRIDHLALWNGAWLGLAAIRKDADWLLYMLRLQLRAAGARVPQATKVFDTTTRDILVRTRALTLVECWSLLEDLMRGQVDQLARMVGEEFKLCEDKNPSVWSFSPNPYPRNERVYLYLSRGSSRPFHEIFGFELFDRLAPQLRGHQPPYHSLREIADGMAFFSGGGMDTNNATAQFEVTAEIPIQLHRSFYNAAHGAIEIGVTTGKDVPLDRLSASVTPEPRLRVLGTEFGSELREDVRALHTLIHGEAPKVDVVVNLQFDDVHIGSGDIRAERASSGLFVTDQVSSDQVWEEALAREFHWSSRALRRAFRAMLPKRVSEIAEWRVQESLLLREEHPFFAVVSAASVAEILLKERLGAVAVRTRSQAWTRLRAEDPRLPRRLPRPDELKFEQAIRLAQDLRLLDGIDSKSVNLLRMARNEIHLDRRSAPPAEDFSPVRASQAILATLDLAKRLATVKRARPRKQTAGL